MIGYISIFEAISTLHVLIWTLGSVDLIDYFGLSHLLHYTFSLSLETSCKLLCESNQRLGVQLFTFMSLGMNFCLCLDLVLTLRSPFTQGSKRMKFYLMGSFALSFFLIAITWSTSEQICVDGGV